MWTEPPGSHLFGEGAFRVRPRPQAPFFLWLRHITGQKLIAVHRQHLGARMRDADREVSLYRGAIPQASSASLAAQLLGRFTSVSRAAVRAELQIRVQEALNGMDPIDREVLALRHFEMLSNAEVGEVLGLRKSAASNRYVPALERLKDILSELSDFADLAWKGSRLHTPEGRPMDPSESGRDPVEELAEEFVGRYRRGERPALTEYTDRYPALAERIRSGSQVLGGDLNGAFAAPQANFFAGDSSLRGGVRVAAGDVDGDGKADVATGSGEGEPSRTRIYLAPSLLASPVPAQDLDPFAGAVLANGVFVG